MSTVRKPGMTITKLEMQLRVDNISYMIPLVIIYMDIQVQAEVQESEHSSNQKMGTPNT